MSHIILPSGDRKADRREPFVSLRALQRRSWLCSQCWVRGAGCRLGRGFKHNDRSAVGIPKMAALAPLSLPTTRKLLHTFSKFWEKPHAGAAGKGRLEVRDVKRKMSRRDWHGWSSG